MDTVKDFRNEYIGGSDIPVILGISKFKTRWQLLQEKAGIIENDFDGNVYTEYGNVMEDKIRQYVSTIHFAEYNPKVVYNGDLRGNLDGFDEGNNIVLEIKTTSDLFGNIETYKSQILFYMWLVGSDYGYIAMYDRPKDFNEEFDSDRLSIIEVNWFEEKELIDRVVNEVDKFRQDLAKLKADPTLTEEDFLPTELQNISFAIEAMETELASIKKIEAQLKEAKAELVKKMTEYGVKKWTTPNGTKITLVPKGEDTVETVFDEKTFKEENADLYAKYLVGKVKKGKSAHIKITLPKNE